MFFVVGIVLLARLSITLYMLWGHERITIKRAVPRAKIEEYWSGDERRQHKRFKKGLEVEYVVEKKPHIKNSKTIDISKGGMKLLLDEKLPEGAILGLKIYIHDSKDIIEVEGEAVWTKECEVKDLSGKRFFYSGIKFIAIREPSGRCLSDYIDSLESSLKRATA